MEFLMELVFIFGTLGILGVFMQPLRKGWIVLLEPFFEKFAAFSSLIIESGGLILAVLLAGFVAFYGGENSWLLGLGVVTAWGISGMMMESSKTTRSFAYAGAGFMAFVLTVLGYSMIKAEYPNFATGPNFGLEGDEYSSYNVHNGTWATKTEEGSCTQMFRRAYEMGLKFNSFDTSLKSLAAECNQNEFASVTIRSTPKKPEVRPSLMADE